MSKLGITELVLRDAHQSLLATRMRVEDMLPVADRLDRIGYWSIESWGGATFDACIRYLGEDPWERIRKLKAAMPNTPQQMLFRGQNILGYRHYADDVVRKFVERAAANGIDVFRVFDAMNDTRNLETAITAVMEQGKHAQGTMAYTVSPVHTIDLWLDLARRIEDMGAHTVCIKDMAGLLKPYVRVRTGIADEGDARDSGAPALSRHHRHVHGHLPEGGGGGRRQRRRGDFLDEHDLWTLGERVAGVDPGRHGPGYGPGYHADGRHRRVLSASAQEVRRVRRQPARRRLAHSRGAGPWRHVDQPREASFASRTPPTSWTTYSRRSPKCARTWVSFHWSRRLRRSSAPRRRSTYCRANAMQP